MFGTGRSFQLTLLRKVVIPSSWDSSERPQSTTAQLEGQHSPSAAPKGTSLSPSLPAGLCEPPLQPGGISTLPLPPQQPRCREIRFGARDFGVHFCFTLFILALLQNELGSPPKAYPTCRLPLHHAEDAAISSPPPLSDNRHRNGPEAAGTESSPKEERAEILSTKDPEP